jgi:hypothetical protein
MLTRTIFFSLLFTLFSACHSTSPKAQAIITSTNIIKGLCAADTISLQHLFVSGNLLDEQKLKWRTQHLQDAIAACQHLSPADTSLYTIINDSLNRTVYTMYITIPLIDTGTAKQNKNVTISFANYFGFNKADDIKMNDFLHTPHPTIHYTNTGTLLSHPDTSLLYLINNTSGNK